MGKTSVFLKLEMYGRGSRKGCRSEADWGKRDGETCPPLGRFNRFNKYNPKKGEMSNSMQMWRKIRLTFINAEIFTKNENKLQNKS